MIFTQEAPLTWKWFSGRSCIQSNWNNLGVKFEEGGNQSARRKPECQEETLEVRLRPTETQSTYNINFVVVVEGVIDVHYPSLTSQGVQHRVFFIKIAEQTGTSVFPVIIAVPIALYFAELVRHNWFKVKEATAWCRVTAGSLSNM